MKAKSKFLTVLERALKEDDTTGAITTDPNSATKASTLASTAQQASGQASATAIQQANIALKAALDAHPEINGDYTKLGDPALAQTLKAIPSATSNT